MSAYTNAVTYITDENQYYVYPMAASLRGGAVESEYNIRNLMSCLFNKSASKTVDDFVLFYNKTINGKRPTLETYSENANWYRINTDLGYCELYDLAIGPGEGNCNGYYTRLYDYTPLTSTSLNIQNLVHGFVSYIPIQTIDYHDGDIEVVYRTVDGAVTSEIDYYKIYKDSKYFYKDDRGTYVSIGIPEAAEEDSHGHYVEVSGTEVIYKVSPAYAQFKVVLGLNWTVNQLVSSAQVSICEDSTIVETISETDVDGETFTRNYTEFTLLNKAMQDRGLLDAGIVLGTIAVKKAPLYSESNGKGTYSYKYSCTYTGNRYKTACIDLAKLGTDSDNLGINLYDKLNRVFSMMIDNGSLKIGTIINGSGFDENPESANHDFITGISPYRLDLGLTNFTPNVSQNFITGYLRVINYTEENNSYSSLGTEENPDLGYILKCDINVDSSTGQPLGIKSLTLFDNGIQLHPESLCIGSTESNKSLYVYGNINIPADKQINFYNEDTRQNIEIKLNSSKNCIELSNLNITSDLNVDTLRVANNSEFNNKFIVNTAKLKLNSESGSINIQSLSTANIGSTGTITANNIDATRIDADIITGAVWQ